MRGGFRQETFQKFLSASLTTNRLVIVLQVDGGRERAANECPELNRDQEPVIRFTTNIGTSWTSALYGYDQMWVALCAHWATSGEKGANIESRRRAE